MEYLRLVQLPELPLTFKELGSARAVSYFANPDRRAKSTSFNKTVAPQSPSKGGRMKRLDIILTDKE